MFKYFIKKRIENNIDENIKTIENLLKISGPLDFSDLIRMADLDDRQLLAVCERAISQKRMQYSQGKFFTDSSGHQFFSLAFHLFSIHKDISLKESIFNELYQKLKKSIEKRPLENLDWSQRHVTIRCTLLRSLYLLYRGDLVDKDIVMIGDDDLASLGIILTGGYKTLTIFEIDTRICEYIRNYCDSNNIKNVTVQELDATEPSFKSDTRYDVCISDPSKELYYSFFDLSKKLIHQEGVIYIFVNPSHNGERAEFDFQYHILKEGCVVTDLIPDFNEYYRDIQTSENFCLDLYKVPESLDDRVRFKESLMRLKQHVHN